MRVCRLYGRPGHDVKVTHWPFDRGGEPTIPFYPCDAFHPANLRRGIAVFAGGLSRRSPAVASLAVTLLIVFGATAAAQTTAPTTTESTPGFTRPSSIRPTPVQTSPDFVPILDRWRLGLPDWDRHRTRRVFESALAAWTNPHGSGRVSRAP